MQLMRLADMRPLTSGDQVFGYSRARAVLLAVVVTGVCTALVLHDWQGPRAVPWLAAAALLLTLVLMRRFILARFRPSNWLVRGSHDGLFVQFRSYLNYHFPSDDLTVVFLAYSEIRSARLVRARVTAPSLGEHSRSERRFRLVEVELTGDLTALSKALAEEAARPGPTERRWYGTTSTVYRDYPVRMVSATSLQIEWHVVPGAEAMLDALRSHTTVEPPVNLVEDLTRLQTLSPDEQRLRLRKLAESGRTITAIYIARRLYSYDLNQAQTLVDGLRGTALT